VTDFTNIRHTGKLVNRDISASNLIYSSRQPRLTNKVAEGMENFRTILGVVVGEMRWKGGYDCWGCVD